MKLKEGERPKLQKMWVNLGLNKLDNKNLVTPAEIVYPGLSFDSYEEALERVLDSNIHHVSYGIRMQKVKWVRYERRELEDRLALEEIADAARSLGHLYLQFYEYGASDEVRFETFEKKVIPVALTTTPRDHDRYTWEGNAPPLKKMIIAAWDNTKGYIQEPSAADIQK